MSGMIYSQKDLEEYGKQWNAVPEEPSYTQRIDDFKAYQTPSEKVSERKLKKLLPSRKRVAKLIGTTTPLSFSDRISVIMSELKQLFCSHKYLTEKRSYLCYGCSEIERCQKCDKIKLFGDL